MGGFIEIKAEDGGRFRAYKAMPAAGHGPAIILLPEIDYDLQAIVGREVDPADFAVVTVASLHAGTTNNIIPGEAELVLNCRFYSDRVKAKVYSAIKRVVHAEVLASGSLDQAMISFFAHGELLDNDEAVFTRVREQFDGVTGLGGQHHFADAGAMHRGEQFAADGR